MDGKSMHESSRVIGRRQFLKAASALGVSAVGVQSVHAEGDRTEIVVTRDSDGPVDTRLVPTKWYNQAQKARKKADKLKKQLIGHSDVASIGIGTHESSIGGLKKKVIEISLEGESTTANVPENVDGIDVKVKTNSSTEYYCYDGKYSTLKGGISLSSAYRTGSACCRVYKNGDPYLLTARHLFTDTGNPCGSTVSDAYQNINNIGSVEDSRTKHDSLWIDITNTDVSLSDGIVGETADVKGWVTQSGLDTYSSDGTTLQKRGINSCDETYTVDSYDNTFDLSCDTMEQVVHYNGDGGGGDSGGIIYYVSDAGKAFVSGILSGGRTVDCGILCSKEVIFGSAAYAMNDQYGLNFD